MNVVKKHAVVVSHYTLAHQLWNPDTNSPQGERQRLNSTLTFWTGRFNSSWTGCGNLLSILWRKGRRSFSPRTRQYLLPTLHFSAYALINRASHLPLPVYCGSEKSHSCYLVSHFCLTLPSGSEYLQPSVDSPWVWPPVPVTWPKPCPTHFDPGDEGSIFAEM